MRRNSSQTADLESEILKQVRASSGVSRVELARALGLAPSTAGVYVERLIAEGFLEETDKAARETGRPPVMLRLNPSGGEFVGVDFEARTIHSVAVDFSDKPLRQAIARIKPEDSAADVLRKIEQTIAKVLPKDSQRLLAIGVGVPGLVDSTEGIAVDYKYLSGWKNVPLAAQLARKFGTPVYLENCVRSMALAELWFGQGLGVPDFVCLGIRSGIGAGMVMDGRLHAGGHHAAGECGRWRYPLLPRAAAEWFADAGDGSQIGPELQEVASARAVQRAFRRAAAGRAKTVLRAGADPLPFEEIQQALQSRDAVATAVVGEAARALGWAISQLCLAVDPNKVILAGPLTALGENLLQPIRAAVQSLLAPAEARVPEIVNSALGEFSGAMGAAGLAVNRWRPAL